MGWDMMLIGLYSWFVQRLAIAEYFKTFIDALFHGITVRYGYGCGAIFVVVSVRLLSVFNI